MTLCEEYATLQGKQGLNLNWVGAWQIKGISSKKRVIIGITTDSRQLLHVGVYWKEIDIDGEVIYCIMFDMKIITRSKTCKKCQAICVLENSQPNCRGII